MLKRSVFWPGVEPHIAILSPADVVGKTTSAGRTAYGRRV